MRSAGFLRPERTAQECRYLVKDFGTSQSPKSTRQRDRVLSRWQEL
ncbi:MAG: hypothetical protein AB2814_10660 [Candidatus Sedimenticola endophacoides]